MSHDNSSNDDGFGTALTLAGVAMAAGVLLKGVGLFSGQTNKNEAQKLFQEATDLYRNGKHNEAVQSLLKSIEKDPTNARAYNLVAWIFALNNFDLQQAFNYVQKAIELADRNDTAIFYDTLAEIYFRNGNVDEAITEFKRSLAMTNSIDQSDADYSSSYRLALCYLSKQDLNNAYFFFKQALQANPQNPFIHSATADTCLGLERYHETIGHYRNAILRTAQWNLTNEQRQYWVSVWLCNTAAAFYYREDYDECWRINEQAYKMNPSSPYAPLNLASLSALWKKKDQMRQFLEDGIPLIDPNQHSDLIGFLLTHPNFEMYREIVLDMLKNHGKIASWDFSQRKKALSESRLRAERSVNINTGGGPYIAGNVSAGKDFVGRDKSAFLQDKS